MKKLNASATIGAISAISVILAAGIFALVWYKLLPPIKENNQKIANTKADIENLEIKLEEIKNTRDILVRLEPTLHKLEMALPDSIQLPELLVTIQAIALDSGISELQTFEVQEAETEEESNNPVKHSLTISGLGAFENIVNLIRDLYNNIRTFNIISISLSPDTTEGAQAGTITFSFNGYVYSEADNSNIAATQSQGAASASETTGVSQSTPAVTP